ncbi:MAG TPA: sigma-70 family RNA polymerase sigma factor [Longimicrobiales bacterium]|nr:sigma-70 family RNA polymerase sigma factor [Longimicrobiales bacterium]
MSTAATSHDEPPLGRPGFAEEALPWLDAVYRFALRLTGGNVAEAEDVAQDTFVRAYRHWHTFERGTSARSWLFTIARNAFLRGRERQSRRPETMESELDIDIGSIHAGTVFNEHGEPDPERQFFDSLVDDEVIRAIESLPHAFREVVVLSDVEGLSYAEIAAVINAPIGTVKSRLYRGRRQLERMLYEYAVDMGHIRRRPA